MAPLGKGTWRFSRWSLAQGPTPTRLTDLHQSGSVGQVLGVTAADFQVDSQLSAGGQITLGFALLGAEPGWPSRQSLPTAPPTSTLDLPKLQKPKRVGNCCLRKGTRPPTGMGFQAPAAALHQCQLQFHLHLALLLTLKVDAAFLEPGSSWLGSCAGTGVSVRVLSESLRKDERFTKLGFKRASDNFEESPFYSKSGACN